MEQKLKASELRLNNYVLEEGEVVLLATNYDLFKCLVNVDRGIGFEPIPLTEEWLLKLGFVLDEEDDGYQRGKYKVSVSEEGCLFFVYFDYYMQELCEFNYIHQLQNLYFALSGQELTFKQQ